jgi:Uma2 family endonuclease
MASSTIRLMSFAEFERLPDSPLGARYELRHGEVFQVPPPMHRHILVQRRLVRLLDVAASTTGEVCMELPYRPLPDYEFRYADVGFVTRDRWERISPTGNLQGAPELVVEVLSPSNTVAEMLERRNVCLENGGREFWLVDIDHRSVEVSTPDGRSITYKSGQSIALLFAPGATLAVDAIFD